MIPIRNGLFMGASIQLARKRIQGGTLVSATNKIVRMEKPAGKECVAAAEAITLLRDKWTILVLGALTHDPSLRYSALRREVGGISQRMLTLTLKSLEESGLVKRTVFASVPPRVDYELTPMGRTLGKPLKSLLQWSTENRAAMAEARRSYARKTA
jgi:DNA-binding HxlR family transcriptional regulator